MPISIGYSYYNTQEISYPEKISVYWSHMTLFIDSSINSSTSSIRAFSIFNILSDFFNYPVALIIFLVIDIKMAKMLKKTLREREKIISSEKIKRENDQTINRAFQMAILNALVIFLLKLPIFISSILEFYFKEVFSRRYGYFSLDTALYNSKDSFSFTSFYFDMKGYYVLASFSNLLYTTSTSLTLLFYFKFDKNFQTTFDRSILKKKVYVKPTKINSVNATV